MALNETITQMRNSSFDSLPNEIILCLFAYLTPVERYKAFFDYNTRLRTLVKHWTEYSPRGLNKDILRFSTLHSWYKHLSFHHGGTRFYIFPSRGQQRRNALHARITDAEQLHWHFFHDISFIKDERIRTVITDHPIYLNPFFYHSQRRSDKTQWRIFYGGAFIVENYADELVEWLQKNYPEHVQNISNACRTWTRLEYHLVPIFDSEWIKALAIIHRAAQRVWNDLKNLPDVNIFNV